MGGTMCPSAFRDKSEVVMTKEDLIKKTVEIVLKHAKPSRIYLYGSMVDDTATAGSDIDIAYDDPKFRENEKITAEVEELSALVKIDVKNVALAEDRFKKRVVDTGRVLFSADKKLRAEDALYNFGKALERFSEAVSLKSELAKLGHADIFPDLVIQRFEFTYEMSWKAIKRYLSFMGIESTTPRSCFKDAFAQGLISDEFLWLDMIEKRNLSSHVYSQSEIQGIVGVVNKYLKAFDELKKALELKLAKA
jgi:nucleotidyltransferase substrate binding protein (TIGR01987 family)